MVSNFLLSVIIPCYNCEDYIYECLSSVYAQIDDRVEIIIVNDGSTDRSLEKIDFFIKKHTAREIKVISQQNQGISAARNAGINMAVGHYLALLDGDDLWENTFWGKIKPILESKSVDLIEFNANRFYHGNHNIRTPVVMVTRMGFLDIKSLLDLRDVFQRNEWFPWSRVYKRELFNKVHYPVGRNYEDVATTPLIYNEVKSIYSLTDELLLYRVREGSITNTPTRKDIDDVIFALATFREILDKSDPDAANILAPAVHSTYGLLRRISTNVHGYCFFDADQIKKIKSLTLPFSKNERISKRIKLYFLREYCQLNRIKSLIKNKFLRR
ncbi:glycosyltransferase [Klebsiella sp. Ap-873]|nr:glycosyltransferase [Klebsiella sp. Ap-873]